MLCRGTIIIRNAPRTGPPASAEDEIWLCPMPNILDPSINRKNRRTALLPRTPGQDQRAEKQEQAPVGHVSLCPVDAQDVKREPRGTPAGHAEVRQIGRPVAR